MNVCSEPHRLRVVEPLRWRLTPRANFPVRDDVQLATSPPLWAVELPGQTKFDLRIENPTAQPVEVKLEFTGDALWFEPDKESVQIALGREAMVGLIVWPRPRDGAEQTATKLYPFTIRLRAPDHTLEIPARLVGVRRGEALAYRYDFDRDGFDDLALENEKLRAIIMPGAGGRAFALIDKATGRNALNTVGGLRDAFSKNPLSYTWKGNNLRRPPWRWPELMLHNREASVRVVRASGAETEVELSYRADDVFPAGAVVRKRLLLAGGGELLRVDYEVEPMRGDAEQSFRAGLSTSLVGELRPAGALLLPQRGAVVSRPLAANQRATIAPEELNARWLAFSDVEAGELLGVFWQGLNQAAVDAQRFSTLVELVSPPLGEARVYRFRLGYFFTRRGVGALQRSYEFFERLPR